MRQWKATREIHGAHSGHNEINFRRREIMNQKAARIATKVAAFAARWKRPQPTRPFSGPRWNLKAP